MAPLISNKSPKALRPHLLEAAAPGFPTRLQGKRFSENKTSVSRLSQKLVIFHDHISPQKHSVNGAFNFHSLIGRIINCTMHLVMGQYTLPCRIQDDQIPIGSWLQAALLRIKTVDSGPVPSAPG